MSLSIGVDLGGTKIEVAVLKDGTEVILRRRKPTESARGYEVILENLASFIEEIVGELGADGRHAPIGVGMPGNVTPAGLIKNANTVCLNGRPFRQDVNARLGRELVFENDANCFALAEALLGAAKEYKKGIVFGVIMGTGVGGGLIVKGEIWSGPQGLAGEWGHHAVAFDEKRSCYCGQRRCMEAYASGPAVEAQYFERSGEKRSLAEIAERRGTDPHAAATIDDLINIFGRAVANLTDMIDPSAIVLGGGVSNLPFLYTEGVAKASEYVFNDALLTPVLPNALGDSAGVLGAALLAAQSR